MPFPADLEALEQQGYRFIKVERCPSCQEFVERFSTPGKREILMDRMILLTSKAVRHYETCNPQSKQRRDSEYIPTEGSGQGDNPNA